MANKKEDKHCECGCNNHEHKCNCQHDEHTCQCGGKEAEYLELAQRIKAEFDNYKKRNAEIAGTSFNNGVIQAVTKLLPCIDAFKQAKSNITDEGTLQGLDMVLSSMLNAFKELGVNKIEALGKEFDPHLHNAVLTGTDPDQAENVILEEYQEGFALGDKVIRHSVVKINKL